MVAEKITVAKVTRVSAGAGSTYIEKSNTETHYKFRRVTEGSVYLSAPHFRTVLLWFKTGGGEGGLPLHYEDAEPKRLLYEEKENSDDRFGKEFSTCTLYVYDKISKYKHKFLEFNLFQYESIKACFLEMGKQMGE